MSNDIAIFMPGDIIHLPTFMLSIIMIEIFLSIMMVLYWKRKGGYPGFGIWAIQLLVMATGHLFTILRGTIPDIYSIFFSNLFHILGMLLILEAATRFTTGHSMSRYWYLILPIELLGILFWYYYADIIAYRTITFSICALTLSILISLVFYYYHQKKKDLFSLLLSGVYSILAIIFLIRATDNLLFTEGRALFEGTVLNNLLYLYILIASIGASFLFFILNFERMASDLERSHGTVARMAKKYDLAISTAGAGIWELNLITGNLIVDPQLLRMFGRDSTTEDAMHFSLEEQIIPEDFALIKRKIEQISHEDEEIQCDYRVRMPDGGIRYFLLHAKSFGNPGGNGLRLIGLNTDVTSLRKTQSALQEAMKKLSILSSITRHDILNCTTVITLNAGLLELEAHTDAERKHITDISTAGDEITRLIRFTGEYEKLGQYDPVWADITQILSKEDFKHLTSAVTLIPPDLGIQVYVDRMLEKVLYNLIENSLRHGEHVHQIAFSYQYDNSDLLIIYTDDGIGILPEDKERIFDHGFGKNTGLGLFLSKEILGMTGFTITEAGIPGSGVRFIIRAGPGLYRDAEDG